MKRILPILIFIVFTAFQLYAQQDKAPDLKAAQNFAVLGPAGVTSSEETVIFGEVAVTNGTITGFNPNTDQGRIIDGDDSNAEVNNTTAAEVQQSAKDAYDFVKNQPTEATLAPQLGNGFTTDTDPSGTNGMVLTPGVYSFNDPNVLLSGFLRLNGLNRPDAVFIFKIEGNLTFEPGSVIYLESGTQAKNIFFQIGGVLVPASTGGIPGANTSLRGNYLVNNNDSPGGEAIRLSEGASVEGRLLALNGSVTLQDNNISLADVVEADLSITKTSSRRKVPIGEIVSFTITVTNHGPKEATNVEVVETFPRDHMEVVSYEVEYLDTPGKEEVINEKDDFRFKLGNLKKNEKVEITIIAKATAPKFEVTNKVAVISKVKDSNPTQDNAQVSVEIPATSANLYVTKTVKKINAKAGEESKYNVGDEIEYTVRVENLGPNRATNVTLTDIFPADYLLVKGVPSVTPGTIYNQKIFIDPYSLNSHNLLTIGNLEAGSDKAVELIIKALIIKSGKITNRAEISNNAVTDPTSLNNRATVTIIAGDVPRVDLQIIKMAGSSTVALGAEVTYTLTARNLSSTDATGVTITDTLAADLKYVRSFPEGQYDEISGTYNWNIGNLAAGAEAFVTLTAIPTKVDQLVNTARISGNQLDLVTTNDVSQAIICVTPSAPVLVAGKTEVCVGDIVTYSVENVTGVAGFEYILPIGFTKITGSGSTIVIKIENTAQENSEISIVPININNLCANGKPLVVRVKINRPPALPGAINGPAAACVASEQTFSIAPVPGAENYTWSVPGNWKIISGQNTASITVLIGTNSGTVSVLVSNSCGIGGSVATSNFNPTTALGAPVITDKSGPCVGLLYTIPEVSGAASYIWTVPEGFTITAGQGTSTIKVTADRLERKGAITVTAINAAGCNSVAATLEVNAKAADANLTFPTAFTPNGDNKNEAWIVENLLKFPENEIQIINRWGNEVYRAKNYQNDWRAAGLGEGTYFYVLRVKLCDNVNKVYRGYITVVR